MRIRRGLVPGLLLASIALGAFGCAPTPIENPLQTLRTVDSGPRAQIMAMEALDAAPEDEAYLEALHRAVWRPGYTVTTREAAVRRLAEHDLDGLKVTIRRYLPRMTAWEGLTRICEIIADEGWDDLTPALVSSWARPRPVTPDDERPEYLALARLHGADRVPDVIFELMLKSNRVSDQGLRTRSWGLLTRLGHRERLIELLATGDVPPRDAFLIDLRAGAVELGIVPANREEILWMRQLRKPEHRAFWNEARAALEQMPEGRAAELELRDLPIVVSAARHEPSMLTASIADLYGQLDALVKGQRHYSHGSNYDGFNVGNRERLYDWRGELTWGDLAAMLMAARALDVPQVVAHLFNYAERDHEDRSTEYGGVIALDAKGRFEILEFPPRIRQHDQKFLAPQAMLDAGYTALFHFHLHVQAYRNTEYAGPGYGDVNYADNTRANCLVFTFVRRDALNVDFYRHGRVLVDLGTIERAGSTARGATARPR
jgi:hypothetical protein